MSTETNLPVKEDKNPIRAFFAGEMVQKKFQEILGSPSRAAAFLTAVLQVVNGSESLKACEAVSVFNAAATAATLDLPINPNLGFAWILPYQGKAQFQMGYKGYIQLAQRSGQYARINVLSIYENQFKSWNELTEELIADFTVEGAGPIVGYVGYFQLINGYTKTVYWKKEKVIAHAKRFSKNFDGKSSVWKTDFDAMAMKTVLKAMLSLWGILSVQMERAIKLDQAIIEDLDNDKYRYIDNEDTAQDKAGRVTDQTEKEMKDMLSKAKGGNHENQ